MPVRFIEIGRISRPHGLKGDVRVHPASSNLSVFRKSLSVYLSLDAGDRKRLEITGIRDQGKYMVLHFRGLDAIEDVESFRGRMIALPEDDFPPLPEGECYQFQILGMDVFTESGEHLGAVRDIIETGSNDVYEVARDNGAAFLLPAIGEVIQEVLPREKKIIIRVMDGLLDAD